MENKDQASGETSTEETIFSPEEFSMEGYDKRIRHARTAMFVVGGAQILAGTISAFSAPEGARLLVFGICLFLAAVFIGLGLWSKKKPFTAIVIALSLYVGLIVLDAIVEPASIVGIFFKIIIIIFLAMGLKDAREAERMKANIH